MNHPEIIKLIIAYTLTGAFVTTVIFTLGSLVGWIKFIDPAQQRKLFYALIVQVVISSIGYFADFLHYDPHQAVTQIVNKDRAGLIEQAPPDIAWALRKMSKKDFDFYLLRGVNNRYFIDPNTEDFDEKQVVEDLVNYGLFKMDRAEKPFDGMDTYYQGTDYGKSVWDFLHDYLVNNTFDGAKQADASLNKS